jgi:hypothetical protein
MAAVVTVGTKRLIYAGMEIDSIGRLIISIGIALRHYAVVQSAFSAEITQ